MPVKIFLDIPSGNGISQWRGMTNHAHGKVGLANLTY